MLGIGVKTSRLKRARRPHEKISDKRARRGKEDEVAFFVRQHEGHWTSPGGPVRSYGVADMGVANGVPKLTNFGWSEAALPPAFWRADERPNDAAVVFGGLIRKEGPAGCSSNVL
ncbi:hypothetical protein C8J57DRAFT_1250675 [Mycena rebaudengoi]|nr:hypothetical protein C8J57DRAFT_1250675 [Mycena rebaudengoi]